MGLDTSNHPHTIPREMGSKGNWAAVVPMALYFIRASPCAATGISPFLARQGWEPQTPVQLLYMAWARQDLGEIDLEEWVIRNSERVENERERTGEQLRKTAELRKKEWDRKARERMFEEGDRVWMRKPGMWKRNSMLSYAIDVGDRVIPSVHTQLLKKCQTNEEEIAKVDRATTVLEPDEVDDEITGRSEVKVEGGILEASQLRDIEALVVEFKETLTKEPGLTNLVEFGIESGDSEPISQRPYNTPTKFRESIDKELDWLEGKGYIRRSKSAWASPIVCVRKPDGSARLCVDYGKLNAVTQPQPFYMPRVEEVLESVGKARFISKMDLAKGYYQVKVKECDIGKTAFVCHRGRFEFTRMPFGVMNPRIDAGSFKRGRGVLHPIHGRRGCL